MYILIYTVYKITNVGVMFTAYLSKASFAKDFEKLEVLYYILPESWYCGCRWCDTATPGKCAGWTVIIIWIKT